MRPVSTVAGRACPIDIADADTDLIIPKQFLKRIDRTGFGPFAFYERRYDDDGEPNPDFPMNKPEHAGAPILLTGRNFGCGSSREHAPWALQDAGFEAIIAPSFADIFRNNCGNIGIVCAQLPESIVRELFDAVESDPSTRITVDLQERSVTGAGVRAHFDIDEHTRHRLLNGLDAIGITLQHEDDIAAFEQQRPDYRPSVRGT